MDGYMEKSHTNKKIIIFDLDDTLSLSKTLIDSEMSYLLARLLCLRKVAIMSGASFRQIQKQVVAGLEYSRSVWGNLYLFPTCGSSLYHYDGDGWIEMYSEMLLDKEKEKISDALSLALKDVGLIDLGTIYGEQLEDRGSQMTFAALGQDAPLEKKKKWDRDHTKRKRIIDALEKYIPEFEMSIGGTTSIDITRKGIDKSYGILQTKKYLNISLDEILYVGDSFDKDGNDYPVIGTGVDYIKVKNLDDTKRLIKILNQII